MNADEYFLERTSRILVNLINALLNGDEGLFRINMKELSVLDTTETTRNTHKIIKSKVANFYGVFDKIDMYVMTNNKELLIKTCELIPEYVTEILGGFVAYISSVYLLDSDEALEFAKQNYPVINKLIQ